MHARSGYCHYTYIDIGIEIEGQDDAGLNQPSLQGRPVLHYRDLQIGPDLTTLGWLYSPDLTSSCNASRYTVDVFSQSEINNAESQSALVTMDTLEVTRKTITVDSNSQNLGDNVNGKIYFRISAVGNDCLKSAHFYSLVINGKKQL